jgi:hypothetical protein
MQISARFRYLRDDRELPPHAPLSCDRGGPVRKIDDVLTELIGQYRARFPELRLAVVQTAPKAW